MSNFFSALGPEMTLDIYRHFPLQISAVGFPSCSDPRVLKNLSCCVALLGIHYQQPGYEVFCCCYERKKRREGKRTVTWWCWQLNPHKPSWAILPWWLLWLSPGDILTTGLRTSDRRCYVTSVSFTDIILPFRRRGESEGDWIRKARWRHQLGAQLHRNYRGNPTSRSIKIIERCWALKDCIGREGFWRVHKPHSISLWEGKNCCVQIPLISIENQHRVLQSKEFILSSGDFLCRPSQSNIILEIILVAFSTEIIHIGKAKKILAFASEREWSIESTNSQIGSPED